MKTVLLILVSGIVFAAAGPIEHKTLSPEQAEVLRPHVENPERPEYHRFRDQYRNPLETLVFFGLEPDMTVVEIWPGGQGGWYRRIIEPYMEAGGGTYLPVPESTAFPNEVGYVPYGEVDMVLVFRAHGFMIYRYPAQTYVNALYDMLKPGGILGIVDHAGDESVPQDPTGRNGYVNESHFRMMAERAGFKLLAESDINRNPKDTKDYPNGVYSLPPTLAGSYGHPELRQRYKDIGESDRFTLKYYKPLEGEDGE